MSFFKAWRPSSFTYLNATQFLAALNDNIFKLLVVYFFIQIDGAENSHRILAVTGAIFVLPFLLFSASSGTMADRFSKRNIIVFTKTLEFITLALGVLAFQYESKVGAYAVLFLMAMLSAVFGPSKYGILPEIVSTEKISRANGLMTSFTFLAIILGTFTASFILDITNRHFIFAALFSTFVAFIAMAASFLIEYTPPSGSTKRFNILFLNEIAAALKTASTHPSLLMAMFGSAFFMFLGAFVQLNIIPFAIQSLNLSDVQGGYLFLLTALGIGAGSILAGKISGATVELGLVPIAGLGIAICCFMMDLFSDQLFIVLPLVIILGLFGGIYQIPLDSYIQVTSPHTSRGQLVAATNFLSFFGVLLASALLFFVTDILGLKSDKGFTIIGSLTLFVTSVIGFQYFDYLTRFVAMILSRMHFKTKIHGVENIPGDAPAIYVCTHTAWNDTLLLLGAQRKRMRFFIQQEQDHSNRWIKRLYKMLRVVFVPEIEPLYFSQDQDCDFDRAKAPAFALPKSVHISNIDRLKEDKPRELLHGSKSNPDPGWSIDDNPICLTVIKNCLKKGISVCIFFENKDLFSEIKLLRQSSSFQEIQAETGCSMIPVIIEKGEKLSLSSPFLARLFNKFRVPAAVSFQTHKTLCS